MNNRIKYAGIGSRECPLWVADLMFKTGKQLALQGCILRSGGADGADTYFENGCDSANGLKEIFLPWKGFNNSTSHLIVKNPKCFKIAEYFHPCFERLSPGAQKLQARNSHQVLGWTLDKPSDFIICYTKGGSGSGGTGQAIRIATHYKIPVFDIGRYNSLENAQIALDSFINKFIN